MRRKVGNALRLVAVAGMIAILGGLAGCSSASNAPIDCNLVKNQSAAGQTDAQIAANLNYPVDQVTACHGAMNSSNATQNMVPMLRSPSSAPQ